MNAEQNSPDLQIGDIQYFPDHRCPDCNAPAARDRRGNWYVPYTDFFGSALRNWESYIGYIYFACECDHEPKPGPGMRVARLGDAMIPLKYSGRKQARSIGLDLDVLNAQEAARAVDFLAKHADPSRTVQYDELRLMLFKVASGRVGPDEAHRRIQSWVFDAASQDQEVSIPKLQTA
ncbi:MAG: DUF3243 domain-containing protein [Chloroflexi bacterium]|nr:DUF3243 domain-containing protein [Chloroflexota bacterium]